VTPRVSVVVPARNAAGTIGRTLDCLAAQELDGDFEVIVVDDDSEDETAGVADRAGVILLRPGRVGAAEARNLGVAKARADTIAFTDSDCFPTPAWLEGGLRALEQNDLVQGRVAPDPSVPLDAFDRTIWVESERGFYETANLFVTRRLFDQVGGFEEWIDTGGEKLLAEDVWFGWRAVRAGARTAFADDALVHHAVFPRGPGGFVSEKLRLRYFPLIAARIPEFRERTLYRHWFLSRRSAAFDLAITGATLALVTRSRLPLVATLPYGRHAVSDTLRFRRRAPFVAAVRTLADATTLGALLAGSVKARSLVL
jgi:glycosyltransferase involved in cell wall biosynthesis